MNEISVFNFEDHDVECILLNGEPLFNPRDIGRCLEMPDRTVRNHVFKMNDKQKILLKNSDGKILPTRKLNFNGENFLTESGVYKLIFKSNAPKAEEFQDWIADEVLPKIRQTGKYEVESQNSVMEKMLSDFLNTFETVTGMKREEIPIQQNQSERAKLANLINDIAKREQIRPNALYDRLYYAYASEFGVHIPELASKANVKVPYYLRKHALLAENIYKFALHFFYQDRNIVELMRAPDQSTLGEFS